VPLVAGGAPMGVLNVWAPSHGDFTAENVEVVHDLAGVLAAALQQANSLEKMRHHARELVALYNSAQAMVSNLDLQTTLKTVLGEARTLLQAEAASVLLQSGDTLVFEAAVGPGAEKIIGARLPITAGIVGWVLREKQPVRVNDAHRDGRFHAAVDQVTGLKTRSVLAAPLITKGQVSGVIEVVNKITPDGQFGVFYEQDLEILVAMAGPAAVAIENARLYQTKIKQFERLQARLAKR
jgi:GAF domain-containing protein